MNNKQLISLIITILAAACIVGGCIYYGLTNQDNDNVTVVNQTNNTTDNATVNSTNITDDLSSRNSDSSSSSSYSESSSNKESSKHTYDGQCQYCGMYHGKNDAQLMDGETEDPRYY